MSAKIIDNKTILITGGTGSFGKYFVKFLLENHKPKKLIILSRDELKQFQMQRELNDKRLRFFLGDIRDIDRLKRAFYGVDIIIHAAALKQVPTLEYNPFEAVQSNILGTQNVINAAIDQGVKKVVLTSTDKAVQPINLYGATKLCAEKLFISANSYGGERTKFSSVRYGNVIGSRGSIIETLLNGQNVKTVQITHPEMTRFWITLEQASNLIMFALENMEGGEIFVPKIPSMKLAHLFDTLAPKARKETIGLRPGEKLHELLLTEQEIGHTRELEKYFVVIPEFLRQEIFKKYFKIGKKIEDEFRYTSDTNKALLSANDLKTLVKKQVELL